MFDVLLPERKRMPRPLAVILESSTTRVQGLSHSADRPTRTSQSMGLLKLLSKWITIHDLSRVPLNHTAN